MADQGVEADSENLVELKSSDGEIFHISCAAVRPSQTVQNIINIFGVNLIESDPIFLPNVDSETLDKVVNWLNYNEQEGINLVNFIDPSYLLDKWNLSWFERWDLPTLRKITLAADFMNIQPLLELCIRTLASRCNESREKIRYEMCIPPPSPAENAENYEEPTFGEEPDDPLPHR